MNCGTCRKGSCIYFHCLLVIIFSPGQSKQGCLLTVKGTANAATSWFVWKSHQPLLVTEKTNHLCVYVCVGVYMSSKRVMLTTGCWKLLIVVERRLVGPLTPLPANLTTISRCVSASRSSVMTPESHSAVIESLSLCLKTAWQQLVVDIIGWHAEWRIEVGLGWQSPGCREVKVWFRLNPCLYMRVQPQWSLE